MNYSTLPEEFSFIDQYFRPLAGAGALDLRDDAAVFMPPAGKEIVIAADSLVENVHFFSTDDSYTVGQKLLRCNLSDLAAMGATPFGYLLTVSCSKDFSKDWFDGFCKGLEADQNKFNCFLLGGDTTSTSGPLVLSLTILGYVQKGEVVKRIGAQKGDEIWVTGHIGDSALGLKILLNELENKNIPLHTAQFLKNRYWCPQPRVGLKINNIASASMDISDGLVQDLGHLARENNLCMHISSQQIPLSDSAQNVIELNPKEYFTCLSGGDDYELLLCIPPKNRAFLLKNAADAGIKVTCIGVCEDPSLHGTDKVILVDQKGQKLYLKREGWSHF